MRTLKSRKSPQGIEVGYDLPTFSLTESQLPEMKNYKVKGKYKMTIEVEMLGISVPEYSDDKTVRGRFRITKVGVEEADPAKRGNE